MRIASLVCLFVFAFAIVAQGQWGVGSVDSDGAVIVAVGPTYVSNGFQGFQGGSAGGSFQGFQGGSAGGQFQGFQGGSAGGRPVAFQQYYQPQPQWASAPVYQSRPVYSSGWNVVGVGANVGPVHTGFGVGFGGSGSGNMVCGPNGCYVQ